MTDLRLDNLDGYVADAIAAGRIASTAITNDVIPYLPHPGRGLTGDLTKQLVPERLFEGRTLVDLEVLMETMDRLICAGTTDTQCFDNSPEHVSDRGWTHRQRDEAATALSRALTVMVDLHQTLQAVQDLLVTRRILERMHARH